MKFSVGRMGAVLRKELREYRRSPFIVGTMALLPLVFLTTHRLEEAERLCDRVAILNTTLRLVGRPDELRESLFSRSLLVETLAPLAAPGDVFNSAKGLESWQTEGESSYVLSVADPRNIAPHVIRALVEAGADVVSITESRHSLEDVYLQLIDEDPEASRR